MKIFVVLFCLIVAIFALPAKIDKTTETETDNAPIEDQNEVLEGAESAYRGGCFGGYGRYRGRGYGNRRSYGGGGFLRTGHREWHGYGPGK